MTTPKIFDLAPANLIQFPTSSRHEEMIIDVLGPCLLKAQKVNGVATTKAKRKAVDSQLIALSVVLKYAAAVLDTGANAIQSHETTILSSTSWKRPKKRLL